MLNWRHKQETPGASAQTVKDFFFKQNKSLKLAVHILYFLVTTEAENIG